MKKYILTIISIMILVFTSYSMYYVFGFYINFNKKIVSFTSNDNKKIYLNNEEFTIKGVNIGTSIPGAFPQDFEIDKETYKRWFSYIKEMGANTIRVYTILSPDFYDAFYEFNNNNDSPLYLIHGVWLNDYILNSKVDALNDNYQNKLLHSAKDMIDVIHGRKFIFSNSEYGSGLYNKDISKWVIGYIVGSDWEDDTIAYTNNKYKNSKYEGEYISTKENTTPFVNMLAYVGDMAIKYESEKYNTQRLFALSNSAITDPFDYSKDVIDYFAKCAKIDVENIVFSNKFIGGTFASYHVYPYYPDYLNFDSNKGSYVDKNGSINTYYAYLKKLNEYHTIPVVISEFGVSTARGMSQIDENNNINQGNMTEKEQGNAIISMYESIMDSNSAGAIVYTWQDEWYKRAWNTMQNVDINYTPYWSDVQTTTQFYGLLSFDPGKEESIVYVDGDVNEWNNNDIVVNNKTNSISMKYDERYIYLMININDYKGEKVYIPIDITPNSGTKETNINDIKYNRNIDFLIQIDGENNSRIYVQDYYDALKAMFSENVYGISAYFNPPSKNTSQFNKINLILQTPKSLTNKENDTLADIYETGKLQYGNANPFKDNYNSLADFIINKDYIEIRIPYQLLNFSNPSKMTIHDDYYKNYGIENLKINEIYLGIGTEKDKNISLNKALLNGWNETITYHERLKESYYILKDYWNSGEIK